MGKSNSVDDAATESAVNVDRYRGMSPVELAGPIRRHLANGSSCDALTIFHSLHPADQGEVLILLSPERQRELLALLGSDVTARILEHLEIDEAVSLIVDNRVRFLPDVLENTSADVAADILKKLPYQQSKETLEGMTESEDVKFLLRYSDETAGALMTVDFPVARERITAANALDILRISKSTMKDVAFVVIVNDSGRIVGTLSVVELALARPSSYIYEIMTREFESVSVNTDQEECARLMERYDMKYLPVVDGEQMLQGVILVEDVVDVLQEEATEDMYRISGMGGEKLFGPLGHSVRRRLPWLYVNLGTTLLAAIVISVFEDTIIKLIALAAFLPVVAGQGGIGGTQTLTLVVRSMALGEIFGERGRKLLYRELSLGLIHGVLLGVVVGLLAYLWKGNPGLGIILGGSMMGNMLIAGLTGAAIPLLLRRLGLDPAVSSAVFVTTITDVFGFLLFLGVAAIFIEWLL